MSDRSVSESVTESQKEHPSDVEIHVQSFSHEEVISAGSTNDDTLETVSSEDGESYSLITKPTQLNNDSSCINLNTVVQLLWETTADTNCNCGWTNKGRIIGGKETKKNAYPFMVAIHDKLDNGGQFCGGTILTPWHVLSAAHCTHKKSPGNLIINIGAHNLDDKSEGKYEVAKFIQHESYNHNRFTNDITLIVTKTQMRYSQNVGPACLPTQRLDITGQKLKAMGWGRTHNGTGAGSLVLREVDLVVSNFKDCYNAWKDDILKPHKETSMCTYVAHKDTCPGDSGGPLVWLDPKSKRYVLAALVSYGGPCGGTLPSGNTDVSAYLQWINKHIAATKPGTGVCNKK